LEKLFLMCGTPFPSVFRVLTQFLNPFLWLCLTTSMGFCKLRREGQAPPLHQILGSFKSITTIETNRLLGTPGQKLWQRSAYEHILRNQQDFDEAAGYIAENPARRLEREEFE
jgi:hypothetical protein